eukprot:7667253-Lingulodinium_polyedra.AAC.1
MRRNSADAGSAASASAWPYVLSLGLVRARRGWLALARWPRETPPQRLCARRAGLARRAGASAVASASRRW